MIFLGIYREAMFSPGRVDDDARILETTLRELASRGHEVRTIHGEELDGNYLVVDCVLTMAESKEALAVLEDWQRRGVKTINGVRSVKSCRRAALFRLLPEAGLPVPEGTTLSVDEAERTVSFPRSRRYWLKRGDVHSVQPGDVVKVSTRRELVAALGHFRRHGIEQIFVQEHVEGESIKFYRVAGSHFFRAFCFSRNREEITDRMGPLCALADLAAQATGLEVFGGDAILTPAGELFLIDLNDWPSFASCRHEAAEEIAAYIESSVE
jgi:hypothetical protein